MGTYGLHMPRDALRKPIQYTQLLYITLFNQWRIQRGPRGHAPKLMTATVYSQPGMSEWAGVMHVWTWSGRIIGLVQKQTLDGPENAPKCAF